MNWGQERFLNAEDMIESKQETKPLQEACSLGWPRQPARQQHRYQTRGFCMLLRKPSQQTCAPQRTPCLFQEERQATKPQLKDTHGGQVNGCRFGVKWEVPEGKHQVDNLSSQGGKVTCPEFRQRSGAELGAQPQQCLREQHGISAIPAPNVWLLNDADLERVCWKWASFPQRCRCSIPLPAITEALR